MLWYSCRLAGDFGFDPLGLGEDPESLKWYVQAELVHARFAMAGVAGILVTDVSGFENLQIINCVCEFVNLIICVKHFYLGILCPAATTSNAYKQFAGLV